MGIFGNIFNGGQKPEVKEVQAAETGKVSLTKGQKVTLTKGQDSIIVKNGWTAQGKDYDLKALVKYKNGKTIYVGAANSDEVLSTPEGAVVHSGDAKNAGEVETLTIKWSADIERIAVSSYSAIENGSGSFRQYGVYAEIVNGPQSVKISAADASAQGNSYTLCFGEIEFSEDRSMSLSNLEMYSRPGSENRVGYEGSTIKMDIGPRGQSK